MKLTFSPCRCSLRNLLGLALFMAGATSAAVAPPAGKYYGTSSWGVSCGGTNSSRQVAGPFNMRVKAPKDGFAEGSAELSGNSDGVPWVLNLTFTDLRLSSSNAVAGNCEFKISSNGTPVDHGATALSGTLDAPVAMLTGTGTNAQGCVVQWNMSDGREFFAVDVGNGWRYLRTATDNGVQTEQIEASFEITGTTTISGQLANVVSELDLTEPPTLSESYRAFDSHGILNLGNNDPTDPLTPLVAPYYQAVLPVGIRQKWIPFRRNGMMWSEDLDGDGHPETVNIQGKSSYVAFEDRPTALGLFENCLHLVDQVIVKVRLSGIHRSIKVTLAEETWFANGIGPVKSRSTISTATKPPAIMAQDEELIGYHAYGVSRGIVSKMLIATNLTMADSDTERPGEPAVASDGTNFLVVTSQDYVPPSGLVGVLVTGGGQVLQRFPITQQLSQFSHPNLIFDGSKYLLTWNQDSQIYGAHISTNGTVLTVPFQISDGTGTQFGARAAFDGQRALVVWAKYTSQYDIVGAFVSPSGTVSNEFFICNASGEQISPHVIFTGTNYFVAWRDTRSGSGPASDTDIYGTVVTPTAGVLDTNGIVLVTTPGAEDPNGLAFDGHGRMLLVWGGTSGARARRFLLDGTSLDGPTSAPGLSIAPGDDVSDPAVAFDGTDFIVAYAAGSYFPPKGLYLARVTKDGVLRDTQSNGLGLPVGIPVTDTTRYLHPAFARGNGNLLLAWLANRETVGELKAVQGAVFYPF